MGKYFGREPRYSREEIERQAQEAIDARVSLGRPPAEDWKPLEARLAEIDRVAAARPVLLPIREAQPMQIRTVRLPQAPAAPAPARMRVRRPVGATPAAD
jgi:hypothetical protein